MLARSLVLTVAAMPPAGRAAEKTPQLTPEQQSLVLLLVQTELASHPHEWTPKTPLCFSIELGDGKGNWPRAQVPKEVLRRLNARGRKVLAADQCLTLVRAVKDDPREREFLFRDANGIPAYLLNVSIPETVEGSGAETEVRLQEKDCAPSSCEEFDGYTARKTKGRWTLAYKGWGAN
jgi:hypothetical protein